MINTWQWHRQDISGRRLNGGLQHVTNITGAGKHQAILMGAHDGDEFLMMGDDISSYLQNTGGKAQVTNSSDINNHRQLKPPGDEEAQTVETWLSLSHLNVHFTTRAQKHDLSHTRDEVPNLRLNSGIIPCKSYLANHAQTFTKPFPNNKLITRRIWARKSGEPPHKPEYINKQPGALTLHDSCRGTQPAKHILLQI